MTLAAAQSPNGRYARRRGSSRRAEKTENEAPTSLIPSFISRAFSGSDTTDGVSVSRKSVRRPIQQWGGKQIRRQFRRPPFSQAASLANFPGAGPFAAGSIDRRRTIIDVAPMITLGSDVAGGGLTPFNTVHPVSPLAAKQATVLPLLAGGGGGLLQAESVILPSSARLATLPLSLDGWVSYPTEAPAVPVNKIRPARSGK